MLLHLLSPPSSSENIMSGSFWLFSSETFDGWSLEGLLSSRLKRTFLAETLALYGVIAASNWPSFSLHLLSSRSADVFDSLQIPISSPSSTACSFSFSDSFPLPAFAARRAREASLSLRKAMSSLSPSLLFLRLPSDSALGSKVEVVLESRAFDIKASFAISILEAVACDLFSDIFRWLSRDSWYIFTAAQLFAPAFDRLASSLNTMTSLLHAP